MNLFKNLLFLHGHFVDPHMDDAAADPADAAVASTFDAGAPSIATFPRPEHADACHDAG